MSKRKPINEIGNKIVNKTLLTSEFNPALCNAHKSIPAEIDTEISL